MIIGVVGNAASIFDKEDGYIIDTCDMIIRFNGGVIINPKSQGTKTTILAFSGYTRNLTNFGKVEYWRTPKFEERTKLEEFLGSRPSNGLVVLEKIKNNYKDCHVKIFGFDWKATETWYKPNHNFNDHIIHNYNKEKEYCLEMISQFKWELY